MDWSEHYPAYFAAGGAAGGDGRAQGQAAKRVEIADVGCGFGGLLVGLAPLFPDTLMLGMEIREKVVEYVRLRILNLRKLHADAVEAAAAAPPPHHFNNAWVL